MTLLTGCESPKGSYTPAPVKAPESTKEWLKGRNLDNPKNSQIFLETQLLLNACDAPKEVKEHYINGFPQTETWIWFKQIGDLNAKLEK